MQITGIDKREQLVRWARRVAELISTRDPPASQRVEQAIEQLRSDRFILTVLGKAKRGKSTLVNALLGRRDDLLAPVDRLPASNVISRFTWADMPSAIVHFRSPDGKGIGRTASVGYERIREFVTEEENPNNHKCVESVEISGPFPGFDRDLVLVDTPGAGSVHEYHDLLLHGVLPQSDAVLFLVTARMPLDADELDLLRKVRAADIRKLFFVVNKVDRTDEGDVEAAMAHNSALLAHAGIQVDCLYRISAKLAFEGHFTESQLPELVDAVQKTMASGKGQVLNARLIARVREAAQPVISGLEFEVCSHAKSAEQLQQEWKALEESRESLKFQRESVSKRFLSRWNQALDRFALGVNDAREHVRTSLLQNIEGTPLTSVARVARDLPAQISDQIDAALRPAAETLETELQTICTDLQADYSKINCIPSGGPVHSSAGGKAFAMGTASGLAAGLTGAGMIAAAQAAAAASVQTIVAPSLLGAALMELTGTASVFWTSVSVPTAVPLWVAAAGPIGWTLAGLGALTIPFAWGISRSQKRDQLQKHCDEHVCSLFDHLTTERIPLLRRTGEQIVQELEIRLDDELRQVSQSLRRFSESHSTPEQQESVKRDLKELQKALAAPGTL